MKNANANANTSPNTNPTVRHRRGYSVTSAAGALALALAAATLASGCDTPPDLGDLVGHVDKWREHGRGGSADGGTMPTPFSTDCVSSHECAVGFICTTEQGVCSADPRCRAGGACDTACWGTCVAKPQPIPEPPRCSTSDQCAAGLRCSTERGECLSCNAGPYAFCPAQCFGNCEPRPGETCSAYQIDGGCRAEADVKNAAAADCERQGQTMGAFEASIGCFAGGVAEAKYTCCGPTVTH